MNVGNACTCEERKQPLIPPAGSNQPPRQWAVCKRHGNHSAFNGYHWTPSDYSSVHCLRCKAIWRTKAGYVALLPDAPLL